MTKNMGSTDRRIRTLAAISIAVLLLTGEVGAIVAAVLGVLAVVLLATSAVSFCPLYAPFKVSTGKKTSVQSR
jgi:hypothetical protein